MKGRSENLRQILARCGVRIVHDPGITTARTELTRDGYVITVHPDVVHDAETELCVLLHELGHIMRGDCLHPVPVHQADAWNRARDALIHISFESGQINILDEYVRHRLGTDHPDAGAVTFARLLRAYPELGAKLGHAYTAEEIVEIILHQDEQEARPGQQDEQRQEQQGATGQQAGQHGAAGQQDQQSDQRGAERQEQQGGEQQRSDSGQPGQSANQQPGQHGDQQQGATGQQAGQQPGAGSPQNSHHEHGGDGASGGQQGQQGQGGGHSAAGSQQDSHHQHGGHACDGVAADPTLPRDEAERIHARTVLRLRQHGLGAGFGQGDLVARQLRPYQPLPLPRIDRILQTIRRATRGGELVRVRTYARPGRVEGLRGVARQPRLRVVFLFDLSGSMVGHRDLLVAAAAWLARTHDVLCVVHDTTAHRVPIQPERWPRLGGGTFAQPAIDLAAQLNPDVIVWATDREFGDRHTAKWPQVLEGRPLVWVLPTGDGLDVREPVPIAPGRIA